MRSWPFVNGRITAPAILWAASLAVLTAEAIGDEALRTTVRQMLVAAVAAAVDTILGHGADGGPGERIVGTGRSPRGHVERMARAASPRSRQLLVRFISKGGQRSSPTDRASSRMLPDQNGERRPLAGWRAHPAVSWSSTRNRRSSSRRGPHDRGALPLKGGRRCDCGAGSRAFCRSAKA